MPFYTYNCILNLAEICEKFETPLRIIYTPTGFIRTKHFLYHNHSYINTDNEYQVVGKFKKINYFKETKLWEIFFENINYETDDPSKKVFMYENVKR